MNNEYRTFDLGLATALSVKGFEVTSLDKTNPRKAEFVFKRDGRRGDIEKAAEEYFTGVLEVSAQGYFNTLKMFKNRLYSS